MTRPIFCKFYFKNWYKIKLLLGSKFFAKSYLDVKGNNVSLKVLMVEDDESIQLIVRLGLVDLGGMDLFFVNHGREALDYLNEKKDQWKPDLIISDVNMPVLDGPGLLRELKDSPKFGSVPVIFLSADDSKDLKKDLILAGAIDVIFKPFNALLLAKTIKDILANYQKKIAV